MALFVLICLDKPNALDLRMATRPAHLAYAGTFSNVVKLGGPILDDKGDMAGSLIVMEGETQEVAQAFNRDDPYTLAGLFQSVQILPFRATIGTL
ncbi:MAG: YciI family protein [Pseudomonadota bacterium]